MGVVNGSDYGAPTLDLNFAKNKSLIDSMTGRNLITFTRAQSNYNTTYIGFDGVMRYASADEPRFDHDPVTGVCNGLLIEESRINYNTNSIGSNFLPSPPKLFERLGFGTFTMSAGTNYTLWSHSGNYGYIWNVTFYLYKIAGNDVVSFNLYATQYYGQSNASTTVDGITLTATSELGGPVSTSITNLGNNLYRLNAMARVNSVGASPSISLNAMGTFVGTEKCYVSHIQAEVGTFPTSYIPTSGSTVTRSADVASITGTNFSNFYNQSEGSFVLSENNSFGVGLNKRLEINQDSSPNFNAIAFSVNYGNGTRITARDSNSTGTLDVTLTNVWTQGGTSKYGYGLQINNSVIVSGSSIITDTACTLPPNLDSFSFGALGRAVSLVNDAGKFTISRLTYYPKRLPNYQLQALTR